MAKIADCYYGTAADGYDKLRNNTPGRQKERHAIAQLLKQRILGHTTTSMLDAPCGTGAFADLYRHLDSVGIDSSDEMLGICNQKHPWLETMNVDMSKPLPFYDNEFSVSLCVRFFWWTPDGVMQQVMKELRRVSRSVIFSIRISPEYGRPEGSKRKSLGHTQAQLDEALGGWRVTDDISVAGDYRMMRAVP